MKPPLCKVCGKEHWSRMCHTDRVERHAPRDDVTQPVTTVVTPRQADLERDNKALRARVEELEEEVRRFKELLAGQAVTAVERARTAAERAKAYRERKRQSSNTSG